MSLSSDLPAEVVSEHDKVELPAIKPFVERHRRLAVRCPSCGAMVVAPVPAAAKGTPFGPRLHAVATYFKTFQALSYERLQGAFDHLFGLAISQGGLMNMLRRAQRTFATKRDDAVAVLRQADVIASDETGVRIEGSNSFHWVFCCADAVVHQASPTRGAVVIRDMMDGHRPAVWLSDRYCAQQGHADAQQTCLAHLARDVAYADEAGEDVLPMRLRLWLQGAFALAARIETLAPATITARRRALERRLSAILETPTSCDLARDLQNRFRRARDQLLTFAKWPGLVDASNNGCERALRPSVIQRKVTNGYRAMWAAAGEADIAPWSTRRASGPALTPSKSSSRPSAPDQASKWAWVITPAKRKLRGDFSLNGHRYRLSITDPLLERAYFKGPDGEFEIGEAALSISLGEPYQGFTYKLIAGMILPF